MPGRDEPRPPRPARVSAGERIAFGAAAALLLLVPVVLVHGRREWDRCVASSTEDEGLCGLVWTGQQVEALALAVLGLAVAAAATWQLVRRRRGRLL